MKAILFGSIGVLCDSSDLQRQAYNATFSEAGIDWHWDKAMYEEMLLIPGGADRVARYADENGAGPVDVAGIHQRKAELYSELLAQQSPAIRSGVIRLIKASQQQGIKVAWVTSTDYSNLESIIKLADDVISESDFDVIIHRGLVEKTKPDPAAYLLALKQLDVKATDAIAVEDTASCVDSATRAGVLCVATPNQFSLKSDYSNAISAVSSLGDSNDAASPIDGKTIIDEQGLVTIDSLENVLR